MHKKRDLMKEGGFPTSKSWPDILKNPPISLLPNTPTGDDHNLKKKGLLKDFFAAIRDETVSPGFHEICR
jgi:hypothetical protein